jgi:hypothetical protein
MFTKDPTALGTLFFEVAGILKLLVLVLPKGTHLLNVFEHISMK